MDKLLNQAPLFAIAGGLFIALLALREGSAWLTRRLASDRGNEHPDYVLTGVLATRSPRKGINTGSSPACSCCF